MLVSVVMPSYNHGDYIAEAIESVFAQTYRPLELVVVDDGSVDASPAIIGKLAQNSPVPFKYVLKDNEGISKTLNRGVKECAGELIAFLASDDRYLPIKIERQVAKFRRNRELGLLHSAAYDDDGAQLSPNIGSYTPATGHCLKDLLAGEAVVLASSMMVRRSVFDDVGGFDPALLAEDRDFCIAVAAKGYEFEYDPQPLLVKRTHRANTSHRIAQLFDVPFQIIGKYRDRLSPAEYERCIKAYYLTAVEAAAGSGQIGLAWSFTVALSRRLGSLGPFVFFARKTARKITLSALPPVLRQTLRGLRANLFQIREQ
jgi:glycosyltransferase involved in cell wall biosynthesis